jgi:parallel beta-helix repeat protein
MKKVECDQGHTLTKALQQAKPAETLQVAGTGHERVTITTDRITLDGGDSAVVNGGGPTEFEGVVTIDGAHGVAFTVQNITVQNNAVARIALERSAADLTDCTVQGNGIGMDVFTSASTILQGSVAFNNNSVSGVEVNGLSVLEIRGAHVQANNNGGSGLRAGSGQIAIFGLTAAQGSTITANGNGFAGIFLGGSQLTVFASGTITAANNVIGIFAGDDSLSVLMAVARSSSRITRSA